MLYQLSYARVFADGKLREVAAATQGLFSMPGKNVDSCGAAAPDMQAVRRGLAALFAPDFPGPPARFPLLAKRSLAAVCASAFCLSPTLRGRMPDPMKLTLLPALLLASLTLHAAPPAKIDVSKLPQQSRAIGDVIVPVPSEIFGVLDRLGKPRWADVLRPMKGVAKPSGEQTQVALHLGTVIAEGFIAVEAQDSAQVEKIGNSVLSLSDALGVRKAVTKRAKAIIDAGNNKDWKQVRKELDRALSEVKGAMAELGSEQLSQLVSLGGWLRGTEALCDVVAADYKRDGADLLHQPLLLENFSQQLEALKGRYKKGEMIGKIQSGLKEMRPLLGLSDGAEISAKSVREVGAISAGLVKKIQNR